MKTRLSFIAVAIAAALALAAPVGADAAKPDNGMSWDAKDKIVAVENVPNAPSARANASGPKITSNAHSGDFPGIYFIWDYKQKDSGYLKVEPWVFDTYEKFTLTSKESNTYWDFTIAIQPGQKTTDDGCYVFYIPKVYNNKNINMVFVGEVAYPVYQLNFKGNDDLGKSNTVSWTLKRGECITEADWNTIQGRGLVMPDTWVATKINYFVKTYGKICYDDFKKDEVCKPGEITCIIDLVPADVNVGFIGYYVDQFGIVRSTSIHWQKLAPVGDNRCISWGEVLDAYAAWASQGGLLLPDPSKGWISSGRGPKSFETGDSACFSDFTADQLEGYYKTYYLDPGYEIPDVVVVYDRYRADVQLWNDLVEEHGRYSEIGTFLAANGGLAHYQALLEYFGAGSLPPYWHFEWDMIDVYDDWADKLEDGLKPICERLNIDLVDFQKNFNPATLIQPTL